MRHIYLLILMALFTSCEPTQWLTEDLVIETSCQEGGEPNLMKSPNGEIILSWIEYLNDTTSALRYASLEGDTWSASTEIAVGDDWFVNWADFPAMARNGSHMIGHWLAKSSAGTYDYDVTVSQSMDGGATWSAGEVLHKDSISAEHGFVSMIPMEKGGFALTWLDGRNTKIASETPSDEHGHGHGGAMSLRYTEIDASGQIQPSVELDARICDCCQTDMAMSTNGPVVVYRDRSEKEIRDIYITRRVDGKWYDPKPVYQDNWEIAGCPVNGPALDAMGETLIVFWYSMDDGTPVLRYSWSTDGGESFGAMKQLEVDAPLGRVDVKLIDEEQAVLVWMEQNGVEGSLVMGQKVRLDGQVFEAMPLVKSKAARQAGFPRMVLDKDRLVLSWTNTAGENTRIESKAYQLL